MIALEEVSVLPLSVDRVNRLVTRSDAQILFSSASELDDGARGASFLERIGEKLGPLEVAFFVGIVSTRRCLWC